MNLPDFPITLIFVARRFVILNSYRQGANDISNLYRNKEKVIEGSLHHFIDTIFHSVRHQIVCSLTSISLFRSLLPPSISFRSFQCQLASRSTGTFLHCLELLTVIVWRRVWYKFPRIHPHILLFASYFMLSQEVHIEALESLR